MSDDKTTNVGMRGQFRVVSRVGDEVVYDSGNVDNVVTKYGIQYLLQALTYDKFNGNNPGYPTSGDTGIDMTDLPAAVGLGEDDSTRAQYYTRSTLTSELGNGSYTRKSVNATAGYYNEGTVAADHTTPSWVLWKAKFPVGQFDGETLTEVGLFNTTTNDAPYLLAATSFTGFVASSDQQVDVTYTVSFTQAT